MKEVIKREERPEISVYSDSLDERKIYCGKPKNGSKFIFRRLANDNYIALTFNELIKFKYETAVGMPLKDSIESFLDNGWPIYELETCVEVLQWMVKKD